MKDPKTANPQPPFPEQQQPHPGQAGEMKPKADHGEESYKGHGRLKGRVALITGGDSGIGRAVAIAFAREGADVAISHLNGAEKADAEETGRWVKKEKREFLMQGSDLSNPDSCQELVDAVVEKFGRIDVLVNNAAFQGEAVERFEDLTPERVRHTFATNIESMFNITRLALGHMKEGAAIINTSSIQGYEPSPPILDYACTKAAIVDFTRGLAKELLKRGIRVNSVAPGPVWTPLIPQSFPEEHVAQFGKSSPIDRPAQPSELAPSFVFLASEDSQFITGEVIAVTGGMRTA